MMKGSFKRKTFLVLFFTMMASLFFASLSVQAASKKVKQPKKIIYVGQTTKLTIKKVSANKATWKSSNKKVATVTKNGKVKATKKGNVTISATYKNTIYQWKITVKKAQLQKSKVTLEEGKTFQLKLLGSQIRSCAVQNKKIATVTKKGKITAKKTGTTKITVVGKNKKTYTCKLTVSKPTPAGNDIIDPENGTVPEVTTSPEDTTDVEDTTTSENPTVPGDSTTSGDPTVSDDSNTSENPTVPDDSNTSDNPTVPGDNTTSGDPTVPDDSTTSGDPTVSDDSNTSDNPTAPDDNAADDSPGGTKGDSSTKADSLLTSIQDAIVTPENLGVPAVLTSKYGNNYYAKSIWDMKTWNGKVFIGTGDYTSNTGPTPIYYFTNDSTEAQKTTATTLSGSTSTSGLSTEAVERFFEIDGNLYTVA
ncbi:MAG: Ig-like domain-containing protein, partial [Lachnospiraceae bacterium]|nr:Ig-like domain-containing protein [Lachnospiraceae bacterium]